MKAKRPLARAAVLLLGALCCAAALRAQEDAVQGIASASQAQAQIDAQRASRGREFDAQAAACYSRFLVNACLDDVKQRRLATMNELQREENSLHQSERMQQGAAELQRNATKQQERTQSDAEQALHPDSGYAQRLQAQQQKQQEHAQAVQSAASAPARSAASAVSASTKAQNLATYAQKQQDAAKHRKEVAQRLQEKAQEKPPLPLPPLPP